MKKTLLMIVGPTAVGKTAMAINLAKHFNTEIISADSRQFYKELEIGTAKPSAEELQSAPHHFINSHSITSVLDAGTFERLALECINTLFEKHDVVIAVGGSGLFIQALCEGLDPVDLRDDDLRVQLAKLSLSELQEKVQELDPDYFNIVDKQNPQRLMRAIEVCMLSGSSYTSLRTGQKKMRSFNIIKIGLEMNREELYQRINTRVDKMLENGLQNEVRNFTEYKNTYALQTVGYSEWFDYFDAKISYDECVELIKRNSRRYAKRQLTWFRRDTETHWFDVHKEQEIINFIENKLNAD